MGKTMKIGMVGLDTSHCPAFTGILNSADNEYHIPGGKVIGAYPGGSEQFSNSRNRVQGFTEQLESEYGVIMYDAIPDLVDDVDAILLESVDGRQHLEQFKQMAVGKPVYIDKPFTTSVAEAVEIIKLAQECVWHIRPISWTSLKFLLNSQSQTTWLSSPFGSTSPARIDLIT